jgi:hypothetical protein
MLGRFFLPLGQGEAIPARPPHITEDQAPIRVSIDSPRHPALSPAAAL